MHDRHTKKLAVNLVECGARPKRRNKLEAPEEIEYTTCILGQHNSMSWRQ